MEVISLHRPSTAVKERVIPQLSCVFLIYEFGLRILVTYVKF